MKLLVINKRRILLPSVLGTQRTELHSMRDALHHQSPGLLSEDVVLQQSRAPAPTSSPSQGCAKPSHHPSPLPSSLAANAPRAASSPYPWLRGSRVPLAGAPLGFLFLTVVSWPTVRWGQARKMNWSEQRSRAQPSPAPSQQRERREDGACAAGDVAKGTASPRCCKAHTAQGSIAPHPPPHCPWSCLSCCGINLYFLTATHVH